MMDDRKRQLVLIGGGGHCKSVLDCVVRMKKYEKILVVDPLLEPHTKLLGVAEAAGSDEMLRDIYVAGCREAFIAVGSIKSAALRKKLWEKAEKIGFRFPVIIDPSAVVSETAFLGEGVFIGKNAVVNAEAQIGRMAIINTGAVIEHECRVGAFAHIAINAVLCGQAEAGEGAFVGAGAVMIQGMKAGMGSVIGAGSVVLCDVGEGQVKYGVVKA